MTILTPEQIEELRQLHAETTQELWWHDDRGGCTAVRTGDEPGLHQDHADIICYSNKGAAYQQREGGGNWDMDEQARKNFAFIAEAHELVPRLLADREVLAGELARLFKAFEHDSEAPHQTAALISARTVLAQVEGRET